MKPWPIQTVIIFHGFPDGQERKHEAEQCLDRLRSLTKNHDNTLIADREKKEKRQKEAERQRTQQMFNRKLSALKERFRNLHTTSDAQRRGYSFQKLLYDLFDLFELRPRKPFTCTGEQIDGAFGHDGYDFLLEAKWQKDPASLHDLRDLDGAVKSKLDNTLGLFVAVNGFSDQALEGYRKGNRPRLLCMDGADLIAVLEGHFDLRDLLRRKREIASQRGNIFVPCRKIMQGVT